MSHGVLAVIPARLGSTRLSRKPLRKLLGRPLIEWVWRRALTCPALDGVVIATDSEEIADAARRFGAEVALTRDDHRSGTDRVAEVADRAEWRNFRTIVNLQGDEPLIDPETIRAAVATVTEGGWGIGSCAAPIRDPAELHDPSVVKVVIGAEGRALYFSRAPVPYPRVSPSAEGGTTPEWGHRHVGLYVFDRPSLSRWVELPPSTLERRESLEQLRALEAGIAIGIAIVPEAEGGVDTPEDLERVERRLQELHAGSHDL